MSRRDDFLKQHEWHLPSWPGAGDTAGYVYGETALQQAVVSARDAGQSDSRCDAPKGKTLVLRVTGQRMISAISPRGDLRFMVVRGGVGAGVFIDFLKRLIHGQPSDLSDRRWTPPAPLEAGQSLRRMLQGRLRLLFLPPYSPELNPDELVWNEVKNNDVGRTLVHCPADLMRAVIGRLRYLPGLRRSFARSFERQRLATPHTHSRSLAG